MKTPTTPDEDLAFIRDSFSSAYTKKYHQGLIEHGGGLWTAGGRWFIEEALNETLDLWSYLTHSARCIDAAIDVAAKLRHGMITPIQAANALEQAVGSHRPNTFQKENPTDTNT